MNILLSKVADILDPGTVDKFSSQPLIVLPRRTNLDEYYMILNNLFVCIGTRFAKCFFFVKDFFCFLKSLMELAFLITYLLSKIINRIII